MVGSVLGGGQCRGVRRHAPFAETALHAGGRKDGDEPRSLALHPEGVFDARRYHPACSCLTLEPIFARDEGQVPVDQG